MVIQILEVKPLTFGGTVPGFIQPQVREAKFNAVNEGKPGDIDNIHDMHKNQGIFLTRLQTICIRVFPHALELETQRC